MVARRSGQVLWLEFLDERNSKRAGTRLLGNIRFTCGIFQRRRIDWETRDICLTREKYGKRVECINNLDPELYTSVSRFRPPCISFAHVSLLNTFFSVGIYRGLLLQIDLMASYQTFGLVSATSIRF